MYSRSSQQLLKRINDFDKRKAAQFIVVSCADFLFILFVYLYKTL